jgi:hypothetical protein
VLSEWSEFYIMSVMPPIHSKSDPLMKRGQTWEIVLNVYNFMKKEMHEAKGLVPEH